MLEYGGGGHDAAGTCQITNLKADEMLDEIVEKINETS
jgi:nanoRNase/pAp phosphatase (c-di-AMP/oligoRNAs hydrolase)